MSVHHFGLFVGRMTDKAVRRIDKALALAGIDAVLITYHDPASGPRGWFTGPNRGAPFDGALARETVAHLRARGLWTDVDGEEGPLPRRVRERVPRGGFRWRPARSS